MIIHLKSPAAIEALIVGPDYAAIPLERKREIARHCQEVPASVLDRVVAVLVTTMTGDERRFTYALFTDAVDPGGPQAGFTAAPASGVAPLTVQFTDTSVGPITGRTWAFGDGNSGAGNNPSHTYTGVGSFPVVLTVSGPSGTSTAQHVVQVLPSGGGGGGGSSADERTGIINIPAGATEVAIVFTPPFATAPLPPACEVVVPAGGDHITDAGIQGLTAAGCTVFLTSATPAAGYQLGFRALHP